MPARNRPLLFRTLRDLALENLALRHQIGVLERTVGERRLRLDHRDRAPKDYVAA
jgi:hypothetical protein